MNDLSRLAPDALDLDELILELAESRTRAITIIPWDFPATGEVSGMWIPTEQADYIFHAKTTSTARRDQIVGHELGHLLLGHQPKPSELASELVDTLAPSIPLELARRVLCRSRQGFTDDEEAMAEQFGTALTLRARSPRPARSDATELGRLSDALR